MKYSCSVFRGMLAVFIGIALGSQASAQNPDTGVVGTTDDVASPRGVLVSLKGGVVLTSPRQVFPSIRVGETTDGTGNLSSRDLGEIGTASRVGIEILVPVTNTLSIVADAANLIWSARFSASATTLPVKLDVQSITVGLGLQGNVYTNRWAYVFGEGLRAVYVGCKLDVGVATLNNRIGAYAFPDTSGAIVAATGSFDNDDPFRNLVTFTPAAGLRFGVGKIELDGEVSYAYALNSVFSSLVVVDNEFTVDNLMFQIGVGYRW